MNLRTLTNKLQACIQEELQARERTLELLTRQERAILDNRSEDLAQATSKLERELVGGVERGARRDEIFRALARLWSVPVNAMTLSSIIERLGSGAGGLSRLRDELRDQTARVVRANRRIAALTRLHRRLVQDVLGALFQEEVDAMPLAGAGTLIDAEA